jgi:hypothetical protein
MTQHQINEEKKRKFEEDIIEVAVAEYYQWVDEKNKKNPLSVVRSQKDAMMFYDAMRLGVIRGINFATNQYMESLRKFEEQKQQEKKDGNVK